MSEDDVLDLVQSASDHDAVGFKSAFAKLMADRIGGKIDHSREEIRAAMASSESDDVDDYQYDQDELVDATVDD